MRRALLLLVLVAVCLPMRTAAAQGNQGQVTALRALSGTAADVASYRNGMVGVAVYRLDTDELFSFQGSRWFTMYSTAKVPIMLAVLDRAVRENRRVTRREQYLIEAMIEWSDNDAANVLIDIAGGPWGVQDFLRRNRIYNTYIDINAWGASTTTAEDMARLIARLGNCMMLVQRLCNYALSTMQNVVDSQTWGVTAGTGNAAVALKNGWYPDDDGWGINSIGLVSGGGRNYAIAVFTYPNPSMSYGISTIEQISTAVYKAAQ